MHIDIQASGLAELRARIDGMKQRADNLGPGLTRAGLVVVRAAKDAIKSGGGSRGPWAPNQTGTPLLFRSGRLINSITVNVSGNTAEVGTNLPYALWNQQGTGVFGPTGQRIFPTHAKALAWPGHIVSSIAGSPARPFLYIDDAQAVRIRAVFADYILKGLSSSDAG